MPAAAFAVATILLLGLLCYSLFHGGHDWPLLFLTGAALAQLFYYLREYAYSSPTSTTLNTPFAYFKVQVTVRKNQLLLRVDNRFYGTLTEQDGILLTTKTEKGHGYGLTNIRAAAEKLGGSAEYYTEGGVFVLDVYFPLQEDATAAV